MGPCLPAVRGQGDGRHHHVSHDARARLRAGHAQRATVRARFVTPHASNNVVPARFFPAESGTKSRPAPTRDRRAAVVLLPQSNSDAEGHIGLAKLLARFGMSGCGCRCPITTSHASPSCTTPTTSSAPTSAARCRCACRPCSTRSARCMARRPGCRHIGMLGTSLGSCLSMLTAAHEPLMRRQALESHFAVFRGCGWRGAVDVAVRQGLEGHIALDTLRALGYRSARSRTSIACATDTLLVYAKSASRPRRLCHAARPRLRHDETAHKVAVFRAATADGRLARKWLDSYLLTNSSTHLHASILTPLPRPIAAARRGGGAPRSGRRGRGVGL